MGQARVRTRVKAVHSLATLYFSTWRVNSSRRDMKYVVCTCIVSQGVALFFNEGNIFTFDMRWFTAHPCFNRLIDMLRTECRFTSNQLNLTSCILPPGETVLNLTQGYEWISKNGFNFLFSVFVWVEVLHIIIKSKQRTVESLTNIKGILWKPSISLNVQSTLNPLKKLVPSPSVARPSPQPNYWLSKISLGKCEYIYLFIYLNTWSACITSVAVAQRKLPINVELRLTALRLTWVFDRLVKFIEHPCGPVGCW